MIPALAWMNDIANEIVAGFVANLVPARVNVIIQPYTPGPTLTWAMIHVGSGTITFKLVNDVESGLDPASSLQKILVTPPAGGWKWAYDGVTPAPPITVYGFALSDATPILLAVTEPLAVPLVLNGPALFELGEMSGLLANPFLL